MSSQWLVLNMHYDVRNQSHQLSHFFWSTFSSSPPSPSSSSLSSSSSCHWSRVKLPFSDRQEEEEVEEEEEEEEEQVEPRKCNRQAINQNGY